jgi:outer membrane protein assembly factor BamB
MKQNVGPPASSRVFGKYVLLAIWIVVILSLLSYFAVGTADQGVRVVMTAAATVLLTLATFLWFAFWSNYRLRTRVRTSAICMAAFAVLALVVRVQGFTGGMFPSFRFVWQTAPDHELVEPQPTPLAPARVDLLTTTPFDFPQFLGPQRNSTLDGIRIEPTWTERPPKLVWKQPIGAGWSSFSTVNGFAVTMEQRGDQELATCYEVGTGRLRWASPITARHETVLGGIGPRSTPTIDEGRVYVLGATGVFRCLRGDDGTELWRHDLVREFGGQPETDGQGVAWGRSGSPLVVDRSVIVPVGGPADGEQVTLVAYDKHTGGEIWRGGEYQVSYSSPVFATLAGQPQIVYVAQDWVCGLSADDGTMLWNHAWPGPSTAQANVSQAIPIDGQRVLLSKGYGHGAELIRLERSSSNVWQVHSEWRQSTLMKTKFSNVVAFGDFVYGLNDVRLECADWRTGKRQWKSERYGYGQLLRVGPDLLVQSEFGNIALVAANPDEYELRCQFQGLSDKTWNVPCLYGRHLLVRNDREAACYELDITEIEESN